VTSASAEFPDTVTAYRRDEPSSGRRTYVVWAKDGTAAAPGPDIAIRVPVRTTTADVVSSTDWVRRTVPAVDGFVTVTSHSDDPSPVVIVAEQGDGPPADVPEAPYAVLLLIAGLGSAALVYRRRTT
jgi:hypothetical protein